MAFDCGSLASKEFFPISQARPHFGPVVMKTWEDAIREHDGNVTA
jgi:hypothetical protein